jgi:hypothetical protein
VVLMDAAYAMSIRDAVEARRPDWTVYVEYQNKVSVEPRGADWSVWFGDDNHQEEVTGSVTNRLGDYCEELRTWLVKGAPAELIADAIVRETEARLGRNVEPAGGADTCPNDGSGGPWD